MLTPIIESGEGDAHNPESSQEENTPNQIPLIQHKSLPSRSKVGNFVRRFTVNVQSLLQKPESPGKSPDKGSPSKIFTFSRTNSSSEDQASPNLSAKKFPSDVSLELTSFSKTSLDNFDLNDDKSPSRVRIRGSGKKDEKASPTLGGLRRRLTTMFTPFSLSGLSEVEEVPQKPVFERPKGWRLIRAAVTIISLAKRSQEAYEEKLQVVMKGDKAKQDLKKRGQRFYLSPRSKKKIAWDSLVSLTMLYYAIIAPIRWSQKINGTSWRVLDVTLDLITLFDIFLSFITGIALNKFLIKKRKDIAKRYLKTYFIVDIIAILPLDWFSFDWYIIKLIRLAHSKRTYNFLKRYFMAFRGGMGILDFVQHLLFFCTTLNCITAVWVYIGRVNVSEGSWMASLPANSNDPLTLAVLANYFFANTVTTVGYGDISPKQPVEMFIIMWLEFLGIILSALLQSNFIRMMKNKERTNYIKTENRIFQDWMSERMKLRENFRNDSLAHEEIPTSASKALMKEIKNHFKYIHSFSYRELTLNNQFYSKLPADFRTPLSLPTFSSIFEKFSIFFNFFSDDDFKTELASRLKPKIFYNYEAISLSDTVPRGLYFLLKGKGILWHKDQRLFEVSNGFYLGDCLILGFESPVEFSSGKGQTYCLYIPASEIEEICSRYPDSKQAFTNLAFRRAEFLRAEINKKLAKKLNDEDDTEANILLERTRARSLRRSTYRFVPNDPNQQDSSQSQIILETSASENLVPESPNVPAPLPSESSEEKEKAKEEEEEIVNKKRAYSREEKKRDDDESDTDDDLNNSMEVPLEDDMLNFDGTDDVDLVLEYIQNRKEIIEFKLERLRKTYREDIFEEWRKMKVTSRKTLNQVKGPKDKKH